MCGIVGQISQKSVDQHTLERMTHALAHRGPDGTATCMLLNGQIGLGHTRLRVIDLSDAADQPMHKHGRTVVFNGEIYNFLELRAELIERGYSFKTSSDTEVLISAFDAWGIEALQKLNGDFAFILCQPDGEVIAARDRIGVKQLLYSTVADGLILASEAKALFKHPEIRAEPDTQTILSDLAFGFWSDKTDTYFKGIHHVPPGSYLRIKDGAVSLHAYWEFRASGYLHSTFSDSSEDALIENLYNTFLDSVQRQTVSDAPLGVLLSGGLDSSLIAAAMRHESDKPIIAFTLEYPGEKLEDLQMAQLLAQSIGLDQRLVRVSSEDVSEDRVDELTYHMEEALWDTAYISVNANYRAAREQGIKVILNGQGADELWLGYYNFYDLYRLSNDRYGKSEFAEHWRTHSFLRGLIDERLLRDTIEANLVRNYNPYLETSDPLARITAFSAKTHLQSMLMQEDRLSMAEGIECRVPFLDYRLVELSFAIASALKLKDGREKYLLRKIGESLLPDAILRRRKSIFPIPTQRDPFLSRERMIERIQASPLVKELSLGKIDTLDSLSISNIWKIYALARLDSVFFQ